METPNDILAVLFIDLISVAIRHLFLLLWLIVGVELLHLGILTCVSLNYLTLKTYGFQHFLRRKFLKLKTSFTSARMEQAIFVLGGKHATTTPLNSMHGSQTFILVISQLNECVYFTSKQLLHTYFSYSLLELGFSCTNRQ